MDIHRISLEPRSGIYLMFYETLHYLVFYKSRGYYTQQLLRIFKDFDTAEKAALAVIIDRKVNCPLIIRDDSYKNKMLRPA